MGGDCRQNIGLLVEYCDFWPSYGGNSRRNIAIPFGMKKTRMVWQWLPNDENVLLYV